MHGLIGNQLRAYTVSHYGRAMWIKGVQATGALLPEGSLGLDRNYPDEAVIAVVAWLATAAGTSVPALLEDFGAFLAAALLRVYSPLLRSEWRTLDVIEHAEEHIHTAVRLRDPEAVPPYLQARRRSRTEVEVVYTSPRQLCALAEGIVRGLAEHYDEQITVNQPECMHRGDGRCVLSIQLLPMKSSGTKLSG